MLVIGNFVHCPSLGRLEILKDYLLGKSIDIESFLRLYAIGLLQLPTTLDS